MYGDEKTQKQIAAGVIGLAGLNLLNIPQLQGVVNMVTGFNLFGISAGMVLGAATVFYAYHVLKHGKVTGRMA